MKWLQNHAFYNKVCTRSTLNTGWETGAVAQWVEVDDWLQKWHWFHSYHQGSSPARTQYLCFICFLFRRWRWKRGGGGRLSRGWKVWEGEKNCSIQWPKWTSLWQVEPPLQHKWKCYRLRGSVKKKTPCICQWLPFASPNPPLTHSPDPLNL